MLGKERYASPGFSLMELMIALIILGLIMAVGIPAYFSQVEGVRKNTTEQNLQLLKTNINLFQMEQAKYPSKLDDLVEKPKGDTSKNWKQYLDKKPLDGWKKDFYYRVTPGGKHPYELYSYGGQAGPEEPAESRISVWDL